MVWLPGAYHAAQDFVTAGFAEAARARRAALDLIFVDLELTHVGDRSALLRLRSEIVLPARAAGVSLWLGGISLGGLFALDYAASFPDELDGLCLLAPYLGNRLITREIAQAPGLGAWRYIKNRRADSPLYLGFGAADRFAAAHALLAATLPPDCVDTIAGGHDWPTWLRLWENFLESRFA
jgi:pimeloyl-ACP methyl ester carboxylesterase